MSEVTISARIPQELGDELTGLAQALGRDRSWVIEAALRDYIASERQFLKAVEEGIRDLEAGAVLDHGGVVAMMEERRQYLPKMAP